MPTTNQTVANELTHEEWLAVIQGQVEIMKPWLKTVSLPLLLDFECMRTADGSTVPIREVWGSGVPIYDQIRDSYAETRLSLRGLFGLCDKQEDRVVRVWGLNKNAVWMLINIWVETEPTGSKRHLKQVTIVKNDLTWTASNCVTWPSIIAIDLWQRCRDIEWGMQTRLNNFRRLVATLDQIVSGCTNRTATTVQEQTVVVAASQVNWTEITYALSAGNLRILPSTDSLKVTLSAKLAHYEQFCQTCGAIIDADHCAHCAKRK